MSFIDNIIKNNPQKIDIEIALSFKEQFLHYVPEIPVLLNDLKVDIITSSSRLFFIIHRFKSMSEYLELKDFVYMMSQIEDVIFMLKSIGPEFYKEVFIWLDEINKVFQIWKIELEEGKDSLSMPPEELFSKVKVLIDTPKYTTKDLKRLNVLFVDDEEDIRKQMQTFLKIMFNDVYLASDGKEGFEVFKKNKPDLIISDINMPRGNGFQLAKSIRQIDPIIPILFLSAFSKNKFIYKSNLLGINSYLVKPVNFEVLLTKLKEAFTSYKSRRSLLFKADNFFSMLEELPILPSTSQKIIDLCNNLNSSIQELITLVKEDESFSQYLIAYTNSPQFHFEKQSTVDTSVSLLGKSNIKSLCVSQVSEMMKDKDKWSLSPYSMTHDDLEIVSRRRMNLMNLWYKKVDVSKLSILSLTAMMGNFGQYVMSRMIKEKDLEERFVSLVKEKGVYEAEIELMHMTSLVVTADILKHWGFKPYYIESIAEAMSLVNTNKNMRVYTFANSVVYSLIEPNNISDEIYIDETLNELFKSENLDIKDLKDAVKEFRRNENG